MSDTQTPVLLLIFNRPDTVLKLIDALSLVKPRTVYIAADGPRTTVSGDYEKCEQARAIAQSIDWPCTIHTRFSDINQGVDPAVEAGISWFFENESGGIILEDDCIPHPDFFTFASEMLEQYRNNEQIMMISGNNFQNGIARGTGDYYVSRYSNTWGWATWRRAWMRYDTRLSTLPRFTELNTIAAILPSKEEQRYWMRYFENLRKGVRSAWDAKWIFAMWVNDGLAIVPNANLVKNIGFDFDATHTAGDTILSIETSALPNSYRAPSSLNVDSAADRYLFDTVYRVTLLDKVRYILHI